MSYSDSTSVLAFTRHLIDGQTTFNSTTRPTMTEVQAFINRCSGVLDVAMAGVGLVTPITNTTAKLACDDWTTSRAAEYVELTQRGTGYSDGEGSRTAAFRNLQKSANEFASMNRQGFVRLGVSASYGKADGLQFTGLSVPAERADRSDTGLVQPQFRRGLFDAPDTADEDSE